jgi:site-specific recombinase XerD
VSRFFTERFITGRTLDPRVILEMSLGRRGHDAPIPTVIEGLRNYQAKKEQQLDIVLTLPSVKRYRQYSGILEPFFADTSGYGEAITFQDLRPALEYDLLHYLLVVKKYKRGYALKVFQYLKSILTYAVAHGWTDRNVLGAVRLKKHHETVQTLTMADIRKLKAMTFVEPNATIVRDMFLFACFSGMAYVDLAGLRTHHIVEVNGVNCFVKDRQKSGVQAFVPVFPDAQQLLDKYARNEMCVTKGVLLPMLSNQKMNQWLKVIGNLAGIKLTLHMHLGRKSFTTYVEELGFTLNDMATMLGHSNVAMTESRYYQRRREPVVTKFKEIFINSNASQKAV